MRQSASKRVWAVSDGLGPGYEEACASFGTKMAGGEKDYQNLLDDLVKGITTSAK